MFDAFAKVVAQADARGEYISIEQLNALSALVHDGSKRMDTVNRITRNASSIVANAARTLFSEQPELTGRNAYSNRRIAACLRDMDIILRYITYAIFTGNSSILDGRCLNGLKETYLALGTPGTAVAAGIKKMKEATLAIINDTESLTQGDCSALASEVGSYFDKAANAIG